MIQILFALVLAEMALILSLLFRTPLRTLVIVGLDRSKQGRGPLVAKSVGGTVLVFFSSTLYGVFSVQKRLTEAGFVNPTDEVLMAHRLLEASLIGFSLFLVLIIDRLHYYIKELNLLRKFNEEVKNLKNDYEQRKNADAEMKKTEIKQPKLQKLKSEE
ncbi:hypothetical protein PRUPE_4G217500 [Prunus persica]|uniref:Endoplasmic reticulum transmembrane protein n=1 Tax=Prunus persica TaxID=3760 RepID=A0A251PP52_PRUPE|nr:uncharacterized protein LOC18780667 [Prunus persica]ONI13361.1 hypothetical protein PRUPE_4G217500 [Prunus persica]